MWETASLAPACLPPRGRADATVFGERAGDASPAVRRAEAAILTASLALTALGIVMIYSTSGVLAERFGSATLLVGRQAAWAVVAAAALVLARGIDYHLYARLRKPVLVATVALLILVLVPGVGSRFNGARRWIRFAGGGLQPSDVAKLGVLIYLAGFLDQKRMLLDEWRRGFLPPFLVLGIVVGLVAAEPDIGTATLIACVGAAMLVIGGVRLRHLVPAGLIVVPLAACYVIVRFAYVWERVRDHFDPSADPLGKGYQARQSLIALASGGAFGRGLGNGSQKHFFLPDAHTDFIFSIVGEELGFVGAVAVAFAFAAILLACWRIAAAAPDRTGAFLAVGVGLWVGLQAALNIAVVTALVPTTGIPLPMVSYGGSALVVTAFALGVVLNVAGHGIDPPRRGLGWYSHTQTACTGTRAAVRTAV